MTAALDRADALPPDRFVTLNVSAPLIGRVAMTEIADPSGKTVTRSDQVKHVPARASRVTGDTLRPRNQSSISSVRISQTGLPPKVFANCPSRHCKSLR